MQPSGSRRAGGLSLAVSANRRTGCDLRLGAFPHRLVCRITNDANAHRSRHSYEPNPLHPIARELAAHYDDHHYHGLRSLFAILATGHVPGFCSAATALLVTLATHAHLLCRANTSCESVAPKKILYLNEALLIGRENFDDGKDLQDNERCVDRTACINAAA